MAMKVMTRMIQRTGRCPLPIHDSFLVPEIDADILSQTMIEVAREYGLQLDLKDSRGTQSTTPLFQLEVTTADLRGSDRQTRWYKGPHIARREIVDTPGTASGARASEPIPPCRGPPDSVVGSGLTTIRSVIPTRWDAMRFGGALPRHSHRSEQESKSSDNTVKARYELREGIPAPRRIAHSGLWAGLCVAQLRRTCKVSTDIQTLVRPTANRKQFSSNVVRRQAPHPSVPLLMSAQPTPTGKTHCDQHLRPA